MTINPLRLKASDIRSAMAKRWTAPEWAIMWEVGEGTGARSGRYADAVMMSLWPSRGLELHGVEIKISRSDWKREAADPTKAEAVAKYCDRWWVHTPEGVVDDISDMPPTWGLREWTGKQWRTVKEAEKTDAQPVTRHFLAAMLRRGDELMKSMVREASADAYAAAQAERAKLNEQFNDRVKREVERRAGEAEGLREQIAKFEAAFGCEVNRFNPDMAAIGRAAKAIADADNGWLEKRADMFETAAAAIREVSRLTKEAADA